MTLTLNRANQLYQVYFARLIGSEDIIWIKPKKWTSDSNIYLNFVTGWGMGGIVKTCTDAFGGHAKRGTNVNCMTSDSYSIQLTYTYVNLSF